MKIIITENRLEKVLKQSGTKKTIELLGGWTNFCKVMNIDNFMDFLHLFDDLEQVQSEDNENWTLFRYKKDDNYMIYDRKGKVVYIDYDKFWWCLEKKFDLNFDVSLRVIKKWLNEVYNLSGITPIRETRKYVFRVG